MLCEDALPASDEHMCLFVAFLSHTMAYSSIINYVSAVKFLHTFLGYPVDWEHSFNLKATIKGYKRILGATSKQKLPVSVDLLTRIIKKCDRVRDSGYIACILTGFFAFLRKANLCPESVAKFNPQFHLSRKDIAKTDYGIVLSIHGSKVIQFRERILHIPLVLHSDESQICPVRAIKEHISQVPADSDSPAFLTYEGSPITHHKLRVFFQQKLLACGVSSNDISIHSLRRGGASYCHQKGIPLEIIQLLGDWSSLAVLLYLARPLEQRVKAARAMAF